MRHILWILLLALSPAIAQEIQAPTRVTPYDWQCQDKDGNGLTNHQRPELAWVSCANRPDGAFIQGGRYRINRPCHAKPEDQKRPATCPDGQIGEWEQTLSFTSVPSPECWKAGEWMPLEPPAEACLTAPVEPTPPAPDTQRPGKSTLTAAVIGNSVRLKWSSAADDVKTYQVSRCTGATCTNFVNWKAFGGDVLEALNSNLPSGATFRYRIRAIDTSQNYGNYSEIATATIGEAEPVNAAPTISGTPSAAVAPGAAYSFQPIASDPDGSDLLVFSITNRPSWATFNAASGSLFGTPSSADVGVHSGITISVSDGKIVSTLPAFSISVTQTASGSAMLSWTAPTQNDDGSSLTNLAGFDIVYGLSSSVLSKTVRVDNPGVSAYELGGLLPGTYYFGVKAYTAGGAVSPVSNIVSKVIR